MRGAATIIPADDEFGLSVNTPKHALFQMEPVFGSSQPINSRLAADDVWEVVVVESVLIDRRLLVRATDLHLQPGQLPLALAPPALHN